MAYTRLSAILGKANEGSAARRRRKAVPPPEGVEPPRVEKSEVGDWCDEYLTRLALTTVKTRNRLSAEPSARTSGTDAAVLGALCSLMRLAGCGCFPAPERVLAEKSNKSADTVAASLWRLAEQAYIIRHPSCENGGVTKYSLVVEKLARLPRSGKRQLLLCEQTELESLRTGDLSHDAYHAKAIKPSARIVYLYLLSHPDLSRAELARQMGKSKQTIGRAVEHLRALGMADEDKDGRWRVSTRRIEQDEDLGEIAEQCRTTGKAATKRKAADEAQARFAALKSLHFSPKSSSERDLA